MLRLIHDSETSLIEVTDTYEYSNDKTSKAEILTLEGRTISPKQWGLSFFTSY